MPFLLTRPYQVIKCGICYLFYHVGVQRVFWHLGFLSQQCSADYNFLVSSEGDDNSKLYLHHEFLFSYLWIECGLSVLQSVAFAAEESSRKKY